MKPTYLVVGVTQAQNDLPKLCRQGRRVQITKPDKPMSVLLPIEDYEAMTETLDLLSNPKAGKLNYRKLSLKDEDLGF